MKNCKQCSIEFIDTVHRTTFCSHDCQVKFVRHLPRKCPAKKTGKNFNCLNCKKEFYVRKYRIERGNVKYCSRSCLAKVHLEQFAHLRWKPTGKPKHKYEYINVNGKQKRLHRHIMEQHLGRKLETWEHVHHIDDNSLNNSIENLVVLSNSDHQKEEQKHRKKLLTSFSS